MFFADRMFKADPFVPQHLGSSLRGGVIARWEEHLCREPVIFFGIPKKFSVFSVFTCFFSVWVAKHNQNLKLEFVSGLFCLMVRVCLFISYWVRVDVHGKVAETAMNRALLANFVSANFPSTFVALRNSAIHSAPAVISEIRPSANVKSKGPKDVCIPRPQVFQCSVFCQLSGRFGPTALAVRCPLWSRRETSAMFETL